MMKADLHIHTCLSPCADITMTPDVIKEKSKGLDVLGILDHNTSKNVRPFIKALRNKVIIPALEIQSVEDVHVLGFFERLEDSLKVSRILEDHLPDITHDHERFGYQLYVDESGRFIGYEDKLLGFPTDLKLDEVVDLILKENGIPVFAHVEKKFGVLYQLGIFPETSVKIAEVVSEEGYELAKKEDFVVITSSDAHTPEDIGRRTIWLDCDDKSIKSVLSCLLNGKVITPWD